MAESRKIEKIYELPFSERAEFCRILNRNNKWEELAESHMRLDGSTINWLRIENNPTDELLNLWGHRNHTILELFILLSKMQHYQSMVPLKQFVDTKYHVLISKGEKNLENLFDDMDDDLNLKDLKIGLQNFNRIKSDRENTSKILVNQLGNSLDTVKILNVNPPRSSTVDPTIDVILKLSLVDAALSQITYEELIRVTNNWNPNALLGKGNFGTVFKGRWNSIDVAVKKIDQCEFNHNKIYLIKLKQSLRELVILNSYRHDNVLALCAYSVDEKAPCLIYKFMPNGSLKDKLFSANKTEPLTWLQRYEIAKGTAEGLKFLHSVRGGPFIHGNIKSANILLDDNLKPKIGDFGLAQEGIGRDHTRPFLPDEFLYGGNLSTKTDTYSYGIVLFELTTGLIAYDDARSEKKFLKESIDNCKKEKLHFWKDYKAGTENEQVYDHLITTGKWCTNKLFEERPEMVEVLEKIHQLQL